MSAVSGWIYVYNMHLTKNTKPETMPIIDTIFIYTYNIQLTEKTLLIQSFSSGAVIKLVTNFIHSSLTMIEIRSVFALTVL